MPLSQREKQLLWCSLLLQLLIAVMPDPFPGGRVITDIDDYRNWLRVLTLQGLEVAYWGDVKPQVDYPPLIPYLHTLLGSALHALSPAWFFNNDVINVLIKLPPVLANLAISCILIRESKTRGIALQGFALPLLCFSPPILFNIAYWGQTDSITALFILLSLLALQQQQLNKAWCLFTVACFIKPLAWPLAPLILLISIHHHSVAQLVRGGVLALACAALILLPFMLDGNFLRILQRLFTQLDVQPYISINAHNFWWLVATPGGRWTVSTDFILSPFTYKQAAITLFLCSYFFILKKTAQQFQQNHLDVLHSGAMVAFAFFMFSPQMHENHLFNFFILGLLPLLRVSDHPQQKIWIHGYITLTLCSFFNMVLHDQFTAENLHQVLRWLSASVSPEGQRLIIELFDVTLTRLNALVMLLVFIRLFWLYLNEHPIPRVWNHVLTLLFASIALVRIFI